MESAVIYLFLVTVFLPFFWFQQQEEGRNYILMAITGVFLIYWLITNQFPYIPDYTTIAVAGFTLWMLGSLAWTQSKQSYFDFYMLFCCLLAFLVARTVPTEILLAIILIPGPIFVIMTMYKQYMYFHRHINRFEHTFWVFGNNNHYGAFIMVHLFVALWLLLNVSGWYAIPLLVMATGIGTSQCKGAIIATVIGLAVTAVMLDLSAMKFVIFLFALGVGYAGYKWDRKDRPGKTAQNRRIIFNLAALYLIKEKIFAGWGLRTFRKEYPNANPKLMQNGYILKIFSQDDAKDRTPVEAAASHRVHNDHLELIFELGIFGYLLFFLIFFSLPWTTNPILSGLVVAFAVDGLFFFPLREVHTALPFWATVGAIAPAIITPLYINPFIILVLVAIILKILGALYFKFQGLVLYDEYLRTKMENEEKRLNLIRLAIERDPYNGKYLTEAYYYHVTKYPEIAFQYASRAMEHYDGGKVKWGIFDQYARALLRLGGFGCAKLALQYALYICPTFKQSTELMGQITQLEKIQLEHIQKLEIQKKMEMEEKSGLIS